jgi:hypothetical protein
MSRSVIEQEALRNEKCGEDLRWLLREFPASNGFSIHIEPQEDDGYFKVRVFAMKEGVLIFRSELTFSIDKVPVIRRYLSRTGALRELFHEVREQTEELLSRARAELLVDDRYVVEDEAKTNREHGPALKLFLEQRPESEIRLTANLDEGYFFVQVHAGEGRLTFVLEQVPVIRRYLSETGELRRLYDEAKAQSEQSLSRARKVLLIDGAERPAQ